MRIKQLLFMLALACPSVVFAQGNTLSGHFGIKAGPSITRLALSGVTTSIPKQKIDFSLGAMYQLRYKNFTVQPEVLYSKEGGTLKVQRVGRTEVVRNNFSYIAVPVLFGWIPTEGIALQAGPQFSYAVNAGSTYGPGTKNDMGIVVGAHYDFLDMLDKFSLQVRYIHGLTNVAPPSAAGIDLNYRNRVLQVAFVYNFYKKKK